VLQMSSQQGLLPRQAAEMMALERVRQAMASRRFAIF